MKKIMLALVLMLSLCQVFAQEMSLNLQEYLEKNVAIAGTKAREVSKTEYVVELTLKDFANTSPLPTGFGIEDRVFADDGRGYDRNRGDGVYTTKSKYTFQSSDRSRVESNKLIYDENFQHTSQVQKSTELQRLVTIRCKFGRIGCPPPTGNCTACIQLGWSCWGMLYCEVELHF